MHIRAAEIAELNDPNFAECGLGNDRARAAARSETRMHPVGWRGGMRRACGIPSRYVYVITPASSPPQPPAGKKTIARYFGWRSRRKTELCQRIEKPRPPRRIRERLKLHRASIARANMPNFRQTPSAYTLGKERDGVPSVLRGVA